MSPHQTTLPYRKLNLTFQVAACLTSAVCLWISTPSRADVSSLFTRVLQARHLFSSGRQAPRMAGLLEEVRSSHFFRLLEPAEERAASPLSEQISQKLNILRSLARRDPIALSEAQSELSRIESELTQLTSVRQSLDGSSSEAQQMFHHNEALLIHAKQLAETRLLAAEVHAAGPEGAQTLRKRWTDELHTARTQRANAAGAEKTAWEKESQRLFHKLTKLSELESAWQVAKEFAETSPDIVLARLEKQLPGLQEKANKAATLFQKHPNDPRIKNAYQKALQEASSAKIKWEVAKEEASAWVAELSVS